MHPIKLLTQQVTLILLIAVSALLTSDATAQRVLPAKPRIVVTADPELDDNNSLIRFLLYSTDYDIEGLIYASSGFHWKGDGKGTNWFVPGREYSRFGLDTCPCLSWRWAEDERFIHNIVDAYAKAYPNLKVHNVNYPTPDLLRSQIRYGNIEFDGDISTNSPGSDLIKSLMLDDKPGPLFITAWGGQSTIARALKSIEEQFRYSADWKRIKDKVSAKVVLLPSGDQDDTYALYIKPNWSDIEYRQFTDCPNYAYAAQLGARAEDSAYLTAAWMKENVSDRGALGAQYRVWGDGKQMVKNDKLDFFGFDGYTADQLRRMGYVVWMPLQAKGSWIGEGDNHTFMNMLGNGLRAFEHASYGGWGGRGIDANARGISFQMSDTSREAMASALSSANSAGRKSVQTLQNFFPAAQRDFAARMKWAVTPTYKEANHQPLVRMNGPLHVMAAPGETIRQSVTAIDPDGQALEFRWWQLPASKPAPEVEIAGGNTSQARISVPKNATAGQQIHIVVEVVDNGTPALTSYQRVIITVREK